MPNNSNDPAVVEVKSDAVSHVRPGLGWFLFSAAVAVFVGSFILIAFFNLATWYDWPALREFLSATFDFGFVLAPILALLGVAASSFSIPAPQRATLAASLDGLRITRERRRPEWIQRDRLVSGLVVPAKNRLELVLTRGEKIVAAISNEFDAQAVLSALGIDPARRRVAVMLGTVQGQLAYGCFMIPVTFFGMVMLLKVLDVPDAIFKTILPGVFPLVLLFAIRSARPLEVVVGTDGIVLKRGFTRRFIPYSALAGVKIDDEARLVLKMRSEKEIIIHKGDEAARRALDARIRHAMQAGGDSAAEGRAELDRLEPRGLSLQAWRETLKGLVVRPGDYRRAGIPEEMLLAVVEDPDAPPERRIGAALALKASGREDAAPKIRIAAEACANEHVRVALERAAEDDLDDETIERVRKL
ncbi:MAG: PH domain-containing protein [Polyangiaceae bacterium]|nr:PH domain-containing protein [Polyangiaceae bacterium]